VLWSMQWANAVLGNPPDAAALEVNFGGLQLEAMVETRVAVGGPQIQVTVNGDTKPLWKPLVMQPGDVLDLAAAGARRNTVAVQGGFETARVLGSRAMSVREGLGGLGDGLQAQPLRAGDLLPCPAMSTPNAAQPAPSLDALDQREPIRYLPLDRGKHFARRARQSFPAASYRISPQSDRMGCRLEGEAVVPDRGVDASFAVLPGCIQVPPDGQPIILLADCQTMGGYPVLGAVIAADMSRLGRCVPGDMAQFRPVTPDAARRAWASFVATLPG
ncbi:biotin-dependent carboxyltransferase family protein, partial [bacterium]|nr:biotin-dependent carboxyltransferase family protein [bacterium]